MMSAMQYLWYVPITNKGQNRAHCTFKYLSRKLIDYVKLLLILRHLIYYSVFSPLVELVFVFSHFLSVLNHECAGWRWLTLADVRWRSPTLADARCHWPLIGSSRHRFDRHASEPRRDAWPGVGVERLHRSETEGGLHAQLYHPEECGCVHHPYAEGGWQLPAPLHPARSYDQSLLIISPVTECCHLAIGDWK